MSKSEKKESGAHGSKPNAPIEKPGWHCGRQTPKPEKVRTLSLENNNDEARQAAVDKQNSSLTSDGTRIRNVIPTSGKSVVTNGGK